MTEFTFQVSRIQFKRLVGAEACQITTLHSGECYSIENMTKTDRLGLLLTGKVNVLNEKTFLHHIHPHEFLDSPEFESSSSDETFKGQSEGVQFLVQTALIQ